MRNFLLFAVMVPASMLGQVTENFSDGDFTQNPSWSGDLNHFKLSSSSAVPQDQRPALQLDAPAAGISCLSVGQQFQDDLEWQFWVKLSLNTSSGNFARIYLFSDEPDLKAPLKGYFLQVGGVEDSVIFFRQDSLEIIRLFRLNTAFTGNSTNALRFKIERDLAGSWKFYCDSLGGHSLTFQGEFSDYSISKGSFFGFSCQYTSSNITKYYFDDFYAGPLLVDSIPPSLIKADVINPEEVLLTFSEAVDLQSAENVSNYLITPGIGNPYDATRLLDPEQVHLFFDHEMENGIQYMLNISSIKDLAGNASGNFSVPVFYYQIAPYDLVFTEIMADPSPPRNLPEFEYLEIFNRSGVNLNVEGLRLNVGDLKLNVEGLSLEAGVSDFVLPDKTIPPEGYLLICDDDALEYWQHMAPSVGVPSFVLPNSGSALELLDTSGQVICFLQYDLSWYGNDLKAEGGWSLEMIDTENPCIMEENWAASVSAEGGTPGAVNSVSGTIENGFRILKACCLSDNELLAEFSESLDSLTATDVTRYNSDPNPRNPVLAQPISPDFRSVRLVYDQEFIPGQIYKLLVNPGLKNCVGDEILSSLDIPFAIAEPLEPFDIVINEVLFNPPGDGVDFVELYNRSNKALDLEELVLASVKHSMNEPTDTQSVDISTSCRVLFPGEYLALTTDPEMVKSQYYTEDQDAFLQMSSFPSYNNDSGYVLLMKKDGLVIDGMDYSEDMHFLMLLSYEGVSLERINPGRLGYDPSNWHSAAETAGFATPGYENSQYLEVIEDDDEISIQPEVFSPDGDGRDDNLGVAYHFNSPGKLITVLIFSSEGRMVRTLVNNEMPGTTGVFTWDGTMDDRTPAQNGIYIIYMEVLAMDGKTKKYKKAGVLARTR